ncbi:head maturation protease, ClpP-related [Weissella paramesenteroides]|uniref:head maturation protease, ClpP-related n=1 Tax=Weissella paramesenteroides TaxID=1249 RepID=UPI00123C41C3|nr:head maturation protease, ClpP-related [Weissella paramesenteroides]KAA8445038.1 Clp protease ClpP [Weissella paramesenteroides]KAA8452625.1 Clp protease ClpP [Weissella paramesenteroides]
MIIVKKINVKGPVVDSDTGLMYDWFGLDYVSPKSVSNILNDDELDPNEDIQVDIASVGGEVSAASEIYTMLRSTKGKVTVNIQGLAASSASLIAMAGDIVNIAPTARIMIHKAAFGKVGGNADDMAHNANVLENADVAISNAYQLKTGLSQADLLQMMSNETWLTAQQAVDKGFADNIMFVDENTPLVTNNIAGVVPNKQAVNKMLNLIAKEKSNNQVPSDQLKQTKVAILLGK